MPKKEKNDAADLLGDGMTLIKGWRTFWRWWSTWLVLVGSTIITFAPQLSEALLYVWQIIPVDIKDLQRSLSPNLIN